MNWDGFKKDWRVWLLIISLLVALFLIFDVRDPYTEDADGNLQLNTNIEAGMDIQGGARIIVEPDTDEEITDELMEQIIDTLEQRIDAFGLADMTIREVTIADDRFVQIELAGAETDDMAELINRTGQFEARIPVNVQGEEDLTLGDQTYTATVDGDQVTVNDNQYGVGDEFSLSSGDRDIPITVRNASDGSATLSTLAFSGEDIVAVDIDSATSGVSQQGQTWQFEFQVRVSQDAARQVYDIVQNFPKGAQNLQGAELELYLDDELISGLGIANEFQDSLITEPLITGGESTREEAIEEMNQLQSVLQSGALPVPVEIVSENRVSATLGQEFLRTAVLAIIFAILAVATVIFIRYKDPKIAIPLTITSFSELVLIFGAAAAIGWNIDLPAIAGIIAAIGTGVDDQIIITDERGKTRLMSIKERFKRAFFIIFTSAASTIGAMIPLNFIGAGAIQGFAITTILGVALGVAITRPAYARFLQYMDEDQ